MWLGLRENGVAVGPEGDGDGIDDGDSDGARRGGVLDDRSQVLLEVAEVAELRRLYGRNAGNVHTVSWGGAV